MIRVEFGWDVKAPAEKTFEGIGELRDYLRTVHFAPTYRIRTHQNEHGRVTSRLLLAVYDDGREFFLGNLLDHIRSPM